MVGGPECLGAPADGKVLGRYKLELRGLAKRFELPVLEDLTLGVDPGDFVCLLGPNGCGKTTLLRILAGLERPDSGAVLVDNEDVDVTERHVRKVGIVFQEPRLLPWKSVRENICLTLKPLGVTGRPAAQRANHYLELVGLHGFEGYYPARLSGGMQQRASIARALAVEPEILLMDEPFSALDAENRRSMQEGVAAIWQATQKTIVFVTHSIEEALTIGRRVVLLTARPARVQRVCDIGPSTDRRALADELLQQLSEEVRRQRELDLERSRVAA